MPMIAQSPRKTHRKPAPLDEKSMKKRRLSP
jgi:hypothetical protein